MLRSRQNQTRKWYKALARYTFHYAPHEAEKSMSLLIRRAAPGDAAAISRVAEEAFAETIDAASPRFRQVLDRGSTLVATIGHDLVAFVDGFVTISPDGETRYEIDLLAVSAAARDRGIGEALVSRSVDEAAQTSASSLRTLVASRNLPMQRLCARLGFTQAPAGLAMYVAAPISIARPTKVEHQAHLIAVTTLTYSGIWLEGMLCQNAIDDAPHDNIRARLRPELARLSRGTTLLSVQPSYGE